MRRLRIVNYQIKLKKNNLNLFVLKLALTEVD